MSDSDRFVIERLRPEHAQGLLDLLNHSVIAHWLGGSRDIADILKMIDADQSRWNSLGYGMLIAVDVGKGKVVARAAVRPVTIEGVEIDELLYTVDPSRWGHSLATDLSRDALNYFFHAKPHGTVYAFTLPENAASVRVMTKLGLQYERDVIHAGMRHVLYSGTADMVAAIHNGRAFQAHD